MTDAFLSQQAAGVLISDADASGGSGVAADTYTPWVPCLGLEQVNFLINADSGGSHITAVAHEVSYDGSTALASGNDDTVGGGAFTSLPRAYHVKPNACRYFKVTHVRLKVTVAADTTVVGLSVKALTVPQIGSGTNALTY